jgi:hypothetical protein
MTKSRKRSFSGQCVKWCPIGVALVLFLFMLFNHFSISTPPTLPIKADVVSVDPSIMNLIRLQNETITSLRIRLKQMEEFGKTNVESGSESRKLDMMYAELAKKQQEIDELKSSKLGAVASSVAITPVAVPEEHNHKRHRLLPDLLRSDFEEECENLFGLGLSDKWKQTKEEWCVDHSQQSEGASSIHCYPYQQEHKKTGRRAQRDMFCEGRNIYIDFSKVKGTHSNSKPPLGSQYLSFDNGATFASCQKTGDMFIIPTACTYIYIYI